MPNAEQRWSHIITITFVMYTIAFIDRTNISMALPSMSRQLHMDPRQAGAAVGVFFWGYVVLQIPAAYLAERWSAKRVVAILLALWGGCAVATAFVNTAHQFWVMRLVLGLAEGGVWPAALVLVSHWFPRAERARANSYWMLCLPLAVVFSSPLSGWLLTHWNWRVLLIVEGAFPFAWMVIWLLGIDDYPREAAWISRTECEFLESTLAREATDLKPAKSEGYLAALLSPQVLILVAIYFTRNCGSYGSLFWLPSAVEKAKSLSNFAVGWLVTIPYILTAILMVLVGRSSDRMHERRMHLSATLAWSGLSFIAALWTGSRHPLISFAFLSIAITGTYASLGPFWSIPTETLPRKTMAPALGLINAIGNLGGYFGPLVVGYFAKRTGGFAVGFGALAVIMLIGSGLSFLLRPAPKRATPADAAASPIAASD
ncbi:MAG: MFS transporter [Terriglobia bacterium]